jgi:hypothetical protein
MKTIVVAIGTRQMKKLTLILVGLTLSLQLQAAPGDKGKAVGPIEA